MSKPTEEERAEQREARRERRSAFLTRMVDEFKKVGFIAIFFVCVGAIVWCLILYGKGVTPTVSPTIPCAAFTILGAAFTFYCKAASDDKKSLNSSGLTKNKDGTISRIISMAADTAATFVANKLDDTNGDDAVG